MMEQLVEQSWNAHVGTLMECAVEHKTLSRRLRDGVSLIKEDEPPPVNRWDVASSGC
jgi:hypothetical protein